jgi:formylmethanofuran dehydrogenase subunit E
MHVRLAPLLWLVWLPLVAFGRGPDAEIETALSEIRAIHGGAGPWVAAGYRMGDRALAELSLPRHSFRLEVVHHTPSAFQYSCMIDGLQASTGASLGKLNLRRESATSETVYSTVTDREAGRTLTFRLTASFVKTFLDVPPDELEEAARRVLSLSDSEIFAMSEDNAGKTPHSKLRP